MVVIGYHTKIRNHFNIRTYRFSLIFHRFSFAHMTVAQILVHSFGKWSHLMNAIRMRYYRWHAFIGSNVWLGSRVMVFKGVTIGENTVVAAGSVVTKSLPANVIAAGVPERVIREIVPGSL